jgi:ribosomal protein L14
MKNLIFILMLIVPFFSCQSSEEIGIDNKVSEAAKATLLQQNESAPQSNAEFNINNLINDLDKKILTLTIGHSGGCDPNYNFKFYLKPRVNPTCSGNDTVYVVLNTNNNCKRLDNTVVTFDYNSFIPCSDKIVFIGGQKILDFPLKPLVFTNDNAGITFLGTNDTIPKSDGEFNIDKAIFDWNKKIATYTIGHSGGCDPNYNFKFYYKPKLTMDCVVDTVHVVLSTKDNCKRLDNTVINFDLATLTMCSKKIVFKGGTKLFNIER